MRPIWGILGMKVGAWFPLPPYPGAGATRPRVVALSLPEMGGAK